MSIEQTAAGTPAPADAVSETQLRFHLDEYRTLRSDLQHEKKAYVDFFFYSVAASGAIGAWILTHRAELQAYDPLVTKLAAAIPLTITVLGFYIAWAVTSTIIGAMGQYCQTIEARIGAPGLGWETFLSKRPKSLGVSRKMLLGWSVLLLVDIGLIVIA